MIECVDADGAPPQELTIAWQCKNWNTLPEAGGYFDQDYRLISTMATLYNIHAVLSRYRNLEGAQIHSLSTADRLVLRSLIDSGVWLG